MVTTHIDVPTVEAIRANRARLGEATHRLPGDPARHHQQDNRIGERGEDRAAAQAIGAPARGQALDQYGRAPGQHQSEHVAEVVAGVGEQTLNVTARVAEGDTRERLWTQQKQLYPGFADYEAKTTRQIPVVILETES